MKPRVEIRYCPACNWLLRSSWMAQELLATFTEELSEVALIPSEVKGQFQIIVAKQLVWDRGRDGGFPDIKTLKQRVRDIAAPERALGHIDK